MQAPAIPVDEAERLAELRALAILDSPPDEAYEDIVRMASAICRTPIALVTLLDGERQWFKARRGLDEPQTPRDVSFCGHAVAAGQPLFVVADASLDARFADNPMVTGAPGVRFYAGATLVSAGGHALGTVCVIDREPRQLDDDQREALLALARQVVVLLELRRRTRALDGALVELAGAQASLRTSERMFRGVVESALEAIAVIDGDGRIVELNRAGEQMLGCARAAVVGEPFIERFVPERGRERAGEGLARYRETGTSPGIGRRRELALVRSDGSELIAELSVAEARADGNGLLTLFLRDVTEQRAVERLKAEFVSVVSHELRTPLTAVRGALGLLESGLAGELPAPAVELLKIARGNTDRLIRLVNDILDLEKIESGRMELRRGTVDVSTLVDETLAALRPIAEPRRITLASEVPSSTLSVDRDRILQVLTNLVGNAIKFSPEGSAIVVRGTVEGGRLRISIVDQGPGIAASDLPRLFRRFQQLDGSDRRRVGGTGLGLAISRAIVEQHGGSIGVDSTLGQGASFWFELDAPDSLASLQRVDAPAGRIRVLLVEHDAELARVLRLMLADEGYEVLRASTEDDAVRLVQSARPSAVLLDLALPDSALPDGAGLALVERLRGVGSDGPRVIVLSGRSRDETYGSPLSLDWITRPLVAPERLLRAVRDAVRLPGAARVLVVDDDEATRRVLAARLSNLGLECFEAHSGVDAVQQAMSRAPDLIVLDVGLPRMDGFEVVDVLRQGRSRVTPLIVYTGRDLDWREREALTLGITRHLTKARTSESEFVGAVRELLSGLLPRTGDTP